MEDACHRAQGTGLGVPYKRTPASEDKKYSWIFDGVTSEGLSKDGLSLFSVQSFGGGASGDEIDRFNVANGSPAAAVVLATSTGLRAYLYRRGAVDSPTCICGAEEETPAHVLLECTTDVPVRPTDWPGTEEDLDLRLRDGLTARPLLWWLIRSGRLTEYKLAYELERSPSPLIR